MNQNLYNGDYRAFYLRWSLFIIWVSVLLLAACQPGDSSAVITTTATVEPSLTPQPSVTQTPTPTQTLTVTAQPTQQEIRTVTATPPVTAEPIGPAGEQVEVEGFEGLKLAGTVFLPAEASPPWPGVILLHMMWGNRGTWEQFAIQLREAGYAVLTIDMRGHGDTGGSVDWDLTVNDIEMVWHYFAERPDVNDESMGLLGASIGANLALITAAEASNANTVVLLSPGLDYAGVKTRDALVSYGERPILIVASQEDTYAADSSQILAESAIGETRLEMYQSAGHGIHMFDREPELGDLILDWLSTYLK